MIAINRLIRNKINDIYIKTYLGLFIFVEMFMRAAAAADDDVVCMPSLVADKFTTNKNEIYSIGFLSFLGLKFESKKEEEINKMLIN